MPAMGKPMKRESGMTKLHGKRFNELEAQLSEIEATKERKHSQYRDSYDHISGELILNWKVKAKSLIANACGLESQHFLAFEDAARPRSMGTNIDALLRIKAVFLAAKEDFEGGYLASLRNLVQAEVFGSELEQASELLAAGYASAAAVIAGVVLETSLRNLCTEHDISPASLNRMNDDLTKAGAYNSLQQKRITAMAAIRNSAAHGNKDEFKSDDVKGMIDDVERFLATTLQ